jgi:hypothetical protein
MNRTCSHDSHQKYELLIGPLREVARSKGYALGVHGSLVFDIDLIACPWTPDAVSAKELAAAICEEAQRVSGIAFMAPHEQYEFPRNKPHGRLCWSFHLGGGPYIDLSVMPRLHEETF